MKVHISWGKKMIDDTSNRVQNEMKPRTTSSFKKKNPKPEGRLQEKRKNFSKWTCSTIDLSFVPMFSAVMVEYLFGVCIAGEMPPEMKQLVCSHILKHSIY